MNSTIKKDYFWNTLGVLLQNAMSPILLIVVTRLNGIYDSGLFSFTLSVAIVFWSLSMWGGRTYQVSDVDSEFASRSYITMRMVLGIITTLVAIVFCAVNQYDLTKTLIILTLVGSKIIESIADSIYGVLQVNDRLYIAGRSLVYKALISFIVFILAYALTKNILFASISLLLVAIVIVIVYDVPKAMEVENISIRLSRLKFYARDSVTIMVRCSAIFAVSFLAIFSLNIPRYYIDLFHESEIGYFGILAMPITLIVLLMSFILQPNIVVLSRMYTRGRYAEFKKKIIHISFVTLAISFIVIVASYIAGVPILNLVFGLSFDGYKHVLMIMLVGATANAFVAIFMNMLTIMRRFKAQFYTLLFTNIVLAVASFSMVQNYGITAGASLYAIANIIQFSILVLVFNRYLNKLEYEKKH